MAHWDADEAALPGWTIYLDLDRNGKHDTGEPEQTTDAAGDYTFANLRTGTYTVAEEPQAGWTQTSPLPLPPGTYTVNLQPGQLITDLDFGNMRRMSLRARRTGASTASSGTTATATGFGIPMNGGWPTG